MIATQLATSTIFFPLFKNCFAVYDKKKFFSKKKDFCFVTFHKMDKELKVTGSVAANTTVGDLSMNSGQFSHDPFNISNDVLNVSNGGFVVNGAVQMDVDVLSNIIIVLFSNDIVKIV